jgi:hypothetical protein
VPICSTCGAEHDVLDPTFRRPEAFQRLSSESRDQHAKANDDLCEIFLPEGPRHFVRGVLPVEVEGLPDDVWWGLWAEVEQPVFRRILELWSDADQTSEPPFDGTLANVIPSYPHTLGLPLSIQLTGPTSRPEFRFPPSLSHPFAEECHAGVDVHRAAEWNRLIDGVP